METKPKPCKGTGLAQGHGCGKPTLHRVYGLGKMCCYSDWLLNSDNGRIKLQKATLKVTKPRLDLEKAKTERQDTKTLSNLLTNAKDACHAYIRQRDKGKPCISCGNAWHEDFQAGHFYKSELFSTLRFDDKNINGQCRRCNLFNEGNESGYRVGILNRFGKEHLDYLDERAQIEKQEQHKWDRDELKQIRLKYIGLFKSIFNK